MDIRFPLGLMFSIVGALLAGFGYDEVEHHYAKHSLGVNVNLWSGLGMLAFGLTVLWLARRAATRPRPGLAPRGRGEFGHRGTESTEAFFGRGHKGTESTEAHGRL